MNPSTSALSKKTKAEILTEYEKLLATREDALHLAHEVHDPQHVAIAMVARDDFTTKAVEDSMSEVKMSITSQLATVSKNVSETLDTSLRHVLERVEKFSALTQAIDLSEKRLKSYHHIDVAATTLELLIADYAEKKKQLELECTAKETELVESIAKKKRDWQREEEEYSYTRDTTRIREEVRYEEVWKSKEEALNVREQAIKTAEGEIEALRAQVKNIPSESEKLVRAGEEEVKKKMSAEHQMDTTLLQKSWESEKKILELKYAHLETQYKKLETECVTAKKEAESAQKKAQELAVTVIEHGGGRTSSRSEVVEI